MKNDPNPTLRQRINSIAYETFYEGVEGPFDDEKEESWQTHWFAVAEKFYDDLLKEDLTIEATTVRTIINNQREIVSKST